MKTDNFASAGFEVAAHMLAHVDVPASAPPLTRAASLHDARYVAWARAALPESAIDPVAADAALLGALLASAPGGHRLQALLALHLDVEAWASGARVEVGDLAGTGWAGAALIALAEDAPILVELARADVGLVARSYGRAACAIADEVEAAAQAVGEHLLHLRSALPAIAAARVRLSHPLGPRGRALPGAIVVGAPAAWNGLSADDAAARVAHEVAVHLATLALPPADDEARWRAAEAAALEAVARRLAGTPFARAHGAFAASLADLGPPPPGHGDRVRHLASLLDG